MVHGDGIAVRRTQLLHHHRIGAGRQRRAGENARRRARRQRMADAAGRDALGHGQRCAGGGTSAQRTA
jgi:hypothetical protein